jgi:hypothetical protein
LRPIAYYLDQRVRRTLARLSTPEELAAHCIIWAVTGTWDEAAWRAQEILFQQWQTGGILFQIADVSLERQLYLLERLRSLSPLGILILQDWTEQIASAVWDHAQPQEEVAAKWGAAWATAGIDCALLSQHHPLWKLAGPESPHLDSLVTGMARRGVCVGRAEPPARLIVGAGLGVHSCDWKKVASRESIRWTPPKLRPLRLIDTTKISATLLPQLLLLGEFDGLIVHHHIHETISLLVTALRDRIITEEQLLDRAYRLILLKEWLALIRAPEYATPG